MAAQFTPGQLQFIARYAQQTGLNPQVVAAEVYNEMNGPAAAARQAAGDHDWLNIGRTDAGPRGAGAAVWNDPISAADASANWVKGTYSLPGFGHASSGIQGILRSVGQGPAAQIRAIQQSGWASSGYPNLPSVFQTVSGTRLPAASNAPAGASGDGGRTLLSAIPGGSLPGALPNALPTQKIPGLVQPGFPDFTRTLLSNRGSNALASALTAQSLSAPFPAFKAPPVLNLPTLPNDTTSIVPTIPQAGAVPTGLTGPSGQGFKPGDPLLMSQQTSVGGEHPTAGLAGYPAYDYFAKAGSETVAPATGKVVKLSGHDPSAGPTEGPHGPFGWSVYIQGDDGRVYYMTHMGSRSVQLGQQVKAGQQIGTVGDYAKYGTPSHIHMGVSAPGVTV